MLKLTNKMIEVLKNADLASGEINNVSTSTMYGLEDRKLVTDIWRKGAISNGIIKTTMSGTFPMYSKVKLTPDGLRVARTIQGLNSGV